MGAVLAGGASSRMGADKAFIEIEGTPMVVRAVGALRAAGARPTLVVGGDAARLDALGLDAVPDRYPGQGPLGGVITALGALGSPGVSGMDAASGTDAISGMDAVVTLPCDVIAPDAAAVRCVLDRLADTADRPGVGAPAADLVVPLGGGVPQWMHAAWRRSCLERLSEAFARGVRAPSEAARQLRTVTVDVPGTGWFGDADRPEDLPTELPSSTAAQRGAGMPDEERATRGEQRGAGMEAADIPEIDIDELEHRRAGGAAVFDVREPDEYEEVRIPGAVLVPLASVPDAVEEFRAASQRTAVCVVCAVGGRSGQAVGFLRDRGVDAVNVAGGTNAWHQSGRPVDTGPAPGS